VIDKNNYVLGEVESCLCGQNIIKYTNSNLIFDETGPRTANCRGGADEGGGRMSLNYQYNPKLANINPGPFLQFPIINPGISQNPLNTGLVAILDTGLHPDFLNTPSDIRNGKYLTGKATGPCLGDFGPSGWNFVADNNMIMDDKGHGTLVAANYVESLNIMTDPNVIYPRLLIVKVLDECGRGNTFDAICGIKYAELQGADIMNLSWGISANHLKNHVNPIL